MKFWLKYCHPKMRCILLITICHLHTLCVLSEVQSFNFSYHKCLQYKMHSTLKRVIEAISVYKALWPKCAVILKQAFIIY